MSRCLGIAMGLALALALSGSAAFAQERDACSSEPRDRLHSAFGWLISLRQVEVREGQVFVTVGYRNVRSASGLIGIGPVAEDHTALVDTSTDGRTPVTAVEGIAVKVRKVERNQASSARFTFPHPGGAGAVRFTSTWMTPIMQGAGQKIQVQFPFELPPRDACS